MGHGGSLVTVRRNKHRRQSSQIYDHLSAHRLESGWGHCGPHASHPRAPASWSTTSPRQGLGEPHRRRGSRPQEGRALSGVP